MITRYRKDSGLKRLWMPLITAAFLGYFGFHTFNGSFGLWAMDRLQADAARLSVELDGLKAEHASLEERVARLRADSLDSDMVDVEARTALNMMRPNELVIISGAPQH
jgi:cell division protein FtsB